MLFSASRGKKVTTKPATKPEVYNGDLLSRYAGAIMAQTLWE